MKIKPGFIIREVAGQSIVVAVGKAAETFNGMVNLNPTGALLWRTLESGATRESLTLALLSQYEIDQKAAEQDVDEFIATILQAGFVEF